MYAQEKLILNQSAFQGTVDEHMRVSSTAMRRTAPVDCSARNVIVAPGSEVEGASSPVVYDQFSNKTIHW
jgi:hypothetical protein